MNVLSLVRQSWWTAAAARNLPEALLQKGTGLVPMTGAAGHGHRATDHAPVVLVHGFAASVGCWDVVADSLRQGGFDEVYAFAYNGLRCPPSHVARSLDEEVTSLLERAGADTVHLVGHSLGGLVVRLAVEYGGLWNRSATVATIATPHRGSALAWAAPGPAGRWMRPGRTILPDPVLAESGEGPRYVNFYGTHDAVVLPRSARLDVRQVTNIEIRRSGHVGATRADEVRDRLPAELLAAEALHAARPAARRSPWSDVRVA